MQLIQVLVVDDEEGMQLGVQRVLETFKIDLDCCEDQAGFEVVTAGSGSECLRVLKEKHIDLLILDHKLPDMQGLDMLSPILTDHPELLVVMVTAFASLEVAISATKRGAYDFLAKPFTPSEMRSSVKKASKHIFLKRKAQQLTEEKKQIRFQFISVLAHELKSPLSAVEGYLRLMNERVAGNDLESYSKQLDRSLIRLDGMRKLIIDLLDLTSIESGQKKRVIEMVNLAEVANDSFEAVRMQAEEHAVELKLETPEDIRLEGDRSEFLIMINNLISNAVKYNKEHGSVILTLEKTETHIIIKCQDTGIGMTPEECSRLFGEFVRMKNEKTVNIAGSGLGLSILKKLVQSYQGTINVESVYEQGTTFTLQMPLVLKAQAMSCV